MKKIIISSLLAGLMLTGLNAETVNNDTISTNTANPHILVTNPSDLSLDEIE